MDGLATHLARWCLVDFHSKAGRIKRDLWQPAGPLLRSQPCESFRIAEVSGHVSAEGMLLGRVSSECKVGNDKANSLAVAGACMDAGGLQLAREVQHERFLVGKAVRHMMLVTAIGRKKCRQALRGQTKAQLTRANRGLRGAGGVVLCPQRQI